ncbi:hypothetical protein Y032_0352g3273 [Ancylostoma ceylanicum]|uniref:Uncharacterized protein n=1 Tax=Ancylostoma ceylanicum TaxID=53326 RepID=A0A016RWM7_9BILA|nr:hypothetical protein Y032_0352g3273 [Ancylostoma ceylanicum]
MFFLVIFLVAIAVVQGNDGCEKSFEGMRNEINTTLEGKKSLYVCYLEKLSKQLLDKIEDSEYWPYSLAIYESDSEDNLAKKALDSFKMYTDKVSAL